jgi:hypothetical protein
MGIFQPLLQMTVSAAELVNSQQEALERGGQGLQARVMAVMAWVMVVGDGRSHGG